MGRNPYPEAWSVKRELPEDFGRKTSKSSSKILRESVSFTIDANDESVHKEKKHVNPLGKDVNRMHDNLVKNRIVKQKQEKTGGYLQKQTLEKESKKREHEIDAYSIKNKNERNKNNSQKSSSNNCVFAKRVQSEALFQRELADIIEKKTQKQRKKHNTKHTLILATSFSLCIIFAVLVFVVWKMNGNTKQTTEAGNNNELKTESQNVIESAIEPNSVSEGDFSKERKVETEQVATVTPEKRITEENAEENGKIIAKSNSDYESYEGYWYSAENSDWILDVSRVDNNRATFALAYQGGYVIDATDIWIDEGEAEFESKWCSGKIHFVNQTVFFEFDEYDDPCFSSYVCLDVKYDGNDKNEENGFDESYWYYLLPQSHYAYISEDDLSYFNKNDCLLARNEIYARYGRKFKDDTIQAYFNSMPWYIGTIEPEEFDEKMLNKYEIKNIETIIEYEIKMGYRDNNEN